MSLVDKITLQKNLLRDEDISSFKNTNDLQKEEIEFLLLLIRQATFKGDQVQIVYNTVLKLQNQYLTK